MRSLPLPNEAFEYLEVQNEITMDFILEFFQEFWPFQNSFRTA